MIIIMKIFMIIIDMMRSTNFVFPHRHDHHCLILLETNDIMIFLKKPGSQINSPLLSQRILLISKIIIVSFTIIIIIIIIITLNRIL